MRKFVNFTAGTTKKISLSTTNEYTNIWHVRHVHVGMLSERKKLETYVFFFFLFGFICVIIKLTLDKMGEYDMYAYIKGIITDIEDDNLVLECNNIGYNIRIPLSVSRQLPGIGAEVKIYTYTSVREDAFNLFGFLTRDDLEIYKKLITVNGIGPKGALGILSAMSSDDLRFAILSGDAKAIAKAPGIGNKSAERIILDLKDKVQITSPSSSGNKSISGVVSNSDAKNEALEALTSLGYTPAEALKAVNQLTITEDMDSGAVLKQALKVMNM